MSPDTRKVIMASARKIIADANDLKRETIRRDFVVEAATILRLCEAEDGDPQPLQDRGGK
jgi:hypothetical protein